MQSDEQLKESLEKLAGRKCLPEGELHVCWLVEQSMEWEDYTKFSQMMFNRAVGSVRQQTSASWQQRAEALITVKGIK